MSIDGAPLPPAATARASACPRCGAATRAADAWCGLCFADLRPPPAAPAPRPAPTTPARPPTATGGTDGASFPARGRWAAGSFPCPVCGGAVLVTADACPACGSDPFAALRSPDAGSLHLPVLGDVLRFSRGARLGLAAVLSVTLCGLLVIIIGLIAKAL